MYIPSNFNMGAEEVEVVVYIHGYYNCIRNIVREKEEGCNCSANGPMRESYNLINQFEKAVTERGSKTNQLFIAAEVAYDQANDSPGRWAEDGLFKSFLNELFTEHLTPLIAGSSGINYSSNNINRIRIFSHSGGYYTIGNMYSKGGMGPIVKELSLLDSLYAGFDYFDSFIKSNISQFGADYDKFRFSSLFTVSGGTYNNNQNMASRVSEWVAAAASSPPAPSASIPIYLLDNSGDDSIAAVEIFNSTALFKLTDYSHDELPRQYFYHFMKEEL